MAGGKSYQMLFQLSASLGGGFNSAFSSGSKSVTELQNKINALNKTNSDIAAYQKQQDAISKTEAKLQRLQTQYDRLSGVEAKTATEEAELQNKMEDKQATIDSTTEKLTQQQAKLEQMGSALQNAGVDTSNLASESERLKAEAQATAAAQEEEARAAAELGDSLTDAISGTAAAVEALGAMQAMESVFNALKDCSEAAAKFETAMANVKRTVGGDDAFIQDLGDSFQALSTQMPITADELAAIATSAGQLGIAQEYVESFTTVMAQLATTTDLSADNAATMLAQFANITGTTDYQRLGSTVAALGDSTATTASKVVEMSQGMAAAANIAGMSETDILALSAAVGSLGIEASSGSTSMSTLISTLYKATETGDKLEDFASVAGMSASEFKTSWSNDAVGTLNSFIQGLNDVERNGKSAVVILDELGITNVRQTKAILGLASAGDLLTNTINLANTAWEENTALSEKAGVMYDTTEAKLTMMQNAANNVQVAIGESLNPAVSAFAENMTNMLQPISEWISSNPAVVQALTSFVGVIGTATAGLTGFVALTKLAAAANTLFSASFPTVGIVLGAAAAVAGVVYAISSLSDADKEAAVSLEELAAEYEALNQQLEEQQNIQDLVDQYESLSKELETIGNIDSGDITLKAKIENDGVTQDNINLIEELKGKIEDKKGEIEQILTISGADQVTDDNLQAIIDLANNTESGDYELKQQLSLLGADDTSDDEISRLRELSGEVKTMEGTISETLELTGFDNYEHMKLVSELPVESKNIKILMQLGITNWDDAKAKLQELGADVLSAKNDLTEAQTTLSELETKAAGLQATLDSTKSWTKQHKEAEKELGDINGQIESQKDTVAQLTDNYTSLQSRYDEVKAAALELKATEDQLAAAEAALGLSAEGAVGSIEEQTAAIRLQAEAQEALVLAKQAELRLTAGLNLGKQALEYADNAKAYENAANRIETATAEINNMSDTAGLKQHLQEIVDTVGELQSQVDDDGFLKYDWDSDEIKAYRTEFEMLLSAATGLEVDTYSFAAMGSALGLLSNETSNADKAVVGLRNDIEATEAEAAAIQSDMQGFIDSTVALIESGAMGADKAEAEMRLAFLEAGKDASEVDAIMEEVNKTLAAHTQAAEEAAEAERQMAEQQEAWGTTSEESKRSIDDMIQDIQSLKEAYNTAYEAAKSSMEGQFTLFQKATQVTGKKGAVNGNNNKNSYVAGLESQEQYINEYTQNYEAAAEKLANAEQRIMGDGSTDYSDSILSQLADGSAESAQILADIAAAEDADMDTLIAAYAAVQAAQDQFASSVAETETNFNETMGKLQQELQDTILAMDFSGEAAAKAEASMSAFCEAISGYEGTAREKAQAVADAINSALNINPTIDVTINANYSGFDLEGKLAEGTKSANKGVYLVGEKGPELVYFNGGEEVINAQESARLMQQSADAINATPVNASTQVSPAPQTYNVSYSPQFHVAAGVGADEVMSALEAQSENMREQFEGIMAEVMEDERRRSLA